MALCGLAALLLLFGELRSLWQSRYPLVVMANTSAGLRPGSQVTVNGVVAGAVEQISLDAEGGPAPVRILAMIDTHVTVPLEARPDICIQTCKRLFCIFADIFVWIESVCDSKFANCRIALLHVHITVAQIVVQNRVVEVR